MLNISSSVLFSFSVCLPLLRSALSFSQTLSCPALLFYFLVLVFSLPLHSVAHLSALITPILSYALSLYPFIFSFNISLPSPLTLRLFLFNLPLFLHHTSHPSVIPSLSHSFPPLGPLTSLITVDLHSERIQFCLISSL